MSFLTVLPIILKLEGPYDPPHASDPGGETCYGICRKWDGNWGGWIRVDKLKSDGVELGNWKNDALLMDSVASYYKSLWMTHGLDTVPEPLQGVLFGGIVNQGPRVVRWLQDQLRVMHQMVDTDGVLGPGTALAIARVDVIQLQGLLWKRRAEAYCEAVDDVPEEAPNLHGWMNRLRQGG